MKPYWSLRPYQGMGILALLALASLTGCQGKDSALPQATEIQTFQAVPVSAEFSSDRLTQGGGLDNSLSGTSLGNFGH